MTTRGIGIDGAFVLRAEPHEDDRGYFARIFDERVFEEAGIPTRFPEHSIAFNLRAGTLRGMHYSVPPACEHKLVRCERGAVIDVLADLRPESPTYGAVAAVELSASVPEILYVPPGCAHGYQTLEDDTALYYMISDRYRPDCFRGFAPSSQAVASKWPLPISCISDRDARLPLVTVRLHDAR